MTTTDDRTDHLTTGWEPEADLPAGDTVLRRFVLHLGEFVGSGARSAGGRAARRPQVVLSDIGRPAALFNSAVLLAPPAPGRWDPLLDEVEDWYTRPGDDGGSKYGEVLLWSPVPTPDLRPRGWDLVGHPPLLVRAPAGGPVPERPPGLRIAEVRDGPGLQDWARVAVDGYPFADLQPYRPGVLLGDAVLADPRWRFWVGYDEGRPVSIGTLFVSHGFAQLALGVTLPEARGRGFWYGMVRERLLAEPGLISGGVFSDDSRPGIEKLGYLPVVRFTLWRLPRPVRGQRS